MRALRKFCSIAACLVAFAVAGPAAQTRARHFLWSVRDSNGAVVYLLGSIHVMPAGAYPLSPDIERLFDASKVLVEELDIDQANDPQALMPMLAKALLTDGRVLQQVVSAETYAAVQARAEKAGLPMLAVERMKPWMVSIALTLPALQAAGFDPDLGLDKHFFAKAKAAGIERRALETVAYQFDRFDQMSFPLQETVLKATLSEVDDEVAQAKELVAEWTVGDTSATEREVLTMKEQAPAVYARLLAERNQNWIAPIERCLQEKAGCFVVVGAAHLVGPDGLPTLLAKKGYAVQQQ